ncbi:NAD+ kinase [Streptosporangium becharense]|uniref:NAD kinase n=1 Tax=Streptosporangium becharense TaxID=1816182 RepID=A0A7W9IKF9_9ACTN|nr:NAD(+)/NADH kinase [Streptosporangium becharense]MBB2913288.1 NAD+ kinase [Streptosporangium becharense]MBB5822271.1 NAD+ kinase [Streptosporangium becharense]
MGMVKTVGLVLHPRRDSKVAIDTIVKWAQAHDVTVYGLPEEVGRIDCSAVPVDAATLVERADLLVSLGGDGTMLRTMRLIQGRPTPILGVNLGKLGFLAEIDVDELPPALSAIDDHDYTVEPRMAVRASLPDGTTVNAFNDIALVRIPGAGLSAVSITVEGHPFVRYAADAVIVATPTGSTAYSFSAGGPIVSPTVEGFLVVPAAAHSAFNRALVLSADEKVELDLLPTSGRLAVEVDGGVAAHLLPGDRLTVTSIRAAAWVVRLGTKSFYDRARRKLRVNGSAEVD